jgi:uncharacterized membrane protein
MGVITLLVIALAVALSFIYFDLATRVFRSFGLTPQSAFLVLIFSLVGSLINIPLTRRRIAIAEPDWDLKSTLVMRLMPYFYYYPPIVTEQVLAINVGGALVPLFFSGYLLTVRSTPVLPAAAATVIVALVSRLASRIVPGSGIALPGFIPPIVAALSAHFITLWLNGGSGSAAPVAYIAGTLGTLIGADLLNLPAILRGALETGVNPSAKRIVSIGGAGVFDGIFLTSIIAPFLA